MNLKKIKQVLNIQKDSLEAEPEFVTFKRVAKQAIAKDYKEVDIFQAFKMLPQNDKKLFTQYSLNQYNISGFYYGSVKWG